ncbi:hypothetical protein FB107DRAFT_244449 [Schizophyllum commune]
MAYNSFPSTSTSAPQQPNDTAPNGVQLVRDSQFLIDSFLPPSAYTSSRHDALPLPFCLPQIATGDGAPFARGYSAIFHEAVDLPMEEFLAFVDGLNLAIVASPPLRVVDLAGKIIGLVPYHWTMIASMAIQAGAQAGMRALSKTLTDRYMRAANLRIFRPRGLAARICTTAAAMQLLGATSTTSGAAKSALNKFGRGVGKVLLKVPLPITSRVVRAVAGATSSSGGAEPMDYTVQDGDEGLLRIQRRLDALGDAALPVSFDIPPPAKAKGAMDTMQAWGVKFDEGVLARQERRRAGRREELAEKRARQEAMEAGDYSDATVRDQFGYRRAARRERRGQGLIGGVLGPRQSILETRVANAEVVDKWETDDTLWLVIVDAARDREIMGIGEAESERDVEIVTEQAWREEIELEQEELADELAARETSGGHR